MPQQRTENFWKRHGTVITIAVTVGLALSGSLIGFLMGYSAYSETVKAHTTAIQANADSIHKITEALNSHLGNSRRHADFDRDEQLRADLLRRIASLEQGLARANDKLDTIIGRQRR